MARSILDITRREPYWMHIPVWKDVKETEFLDYDWQVCLGYEFPLSLKCLHVLGFKHRPGERQTRPVSIQRPPRGDTL